MTDKFIITTIIRHDMEWNPTDFCVACKRYTTYVVSGVDRIFCVMGCNPTDTPLDGVCS